VDDDGNRPVLFILPQLLRSFLLLELERKRNQRGLKYLNEINKLWTEVSCEWIKFFLEHKKEEGTQ
jgi:hypothetical protein